MKKKITTTMILASLLLTGCSANTSSADSSAAVTAAPTTEYRTTEETAPTDELESSAPAASAETSAVDTAEADNTESSSQAEQGYVLKGPGGDIVTAAEVTRVDAIDEDDYRANGLSETNWRQAECSGFAYAAEPGGAYRRISMGDEICGLTVFNAECVFNSDNPERAGQHADEGSFSSGFVEFEGSVQLTGTLSVCAESSGLVDAGSVIFTPDAGAQLPVMNYTFTEEDGVTYPADDMYPPIVLSGVETDADGAHAAVTLTGISMSSSVNFGSVVRAEASEITFG